MRFFTTPDGLALTFGGRRAKNNTIRSHSARQVDSAWEELDSLQAHPRCESYNALGEQVLLALDSPAWAKLRHAYGAASDIPPLLESACRLPPDSGYETEPYFSLWSALCHQGDVFTASYAAVPHLVNALSNATVPFPKSPMLLVICIEIARLKGLGPDLPAELAEPYSSALMRLPALANAMTSVPCDEAQCTLAAAAIAVANRFAGLAEVMIELEPDTIDSVVSWLQSR